MTPTRLVMGTLLLAAAVVAAGCEMTGELHGSGTPSPGVDAGDDTAQIARAAFDSDVAPLLEGFCAACHSAADSVGFMAPDPDMYSSVTTWPLLIDLENHSSSRLLSKGVHDGPAWTADQRAIIGDWLGLETIAAGVVPVVEPETAPFAPVVGSNTVDLAQIGMTGSSVTFRLEKLQVGYYISELMVNAGIEGAHLVHPLFVTWSESVPAPDPVDRFSGVEVNADPSQSAMIGGGTVVLVNVPEGAMLSIHFATAEPAIANPGLPASGCKVVASFTQNARSPLSASCGSCHAGGNASATTAISAGSTEPRSSPAGQIVVCGQALSRVSLGDPLNSGLFVATNPALGAAHPFKFNGDAIAFNAFREAVLAWINAEIVAP